jgi:hypothetical protein
LSVYYYLLTQSGNFLTLPHRWEDIRMGLRETGWQHADSVHPAHDSNQWQAVVNMVNNLQVPQKAGISSVV